MYKRKMMSLFLALVLVVSLAVSAYGLAYCQTQVGTGICGKLLTAKSYNSAVYSASHTYGGFLGIGKKTCNYEYYYVYSTLSCSSGHVANQTTTTVETGHTCGK